MKTEENNILINGEFNIILTEKDEYEIIDKEKTTNYVKDTSAILKRDLINVYDRLKDLEKKFHIKIKELDEMEEMWNIQDYEIKEIVKAQGEKIVKFNIGGVKFSTKIKTLLTLKSTLFSKMVLSQEFDFDEEIFIDRSPKMFNHILNFMRYRTLNYSEMTDIQIALLLQEAEYYEVRPIIDLIRNKQDEFIKFVNFGDIVPIYLDSQFVGTNRIEDLYDRNLKTGICSYDGKIVIELEKVTEIEEIEIGWMIFENDNIIYYLSSTTVETATDKLNYTNVATIFNNLTTIEKVKFNKKTKTKFIRFTRIGRIGLGYLKIII